MTHNELINNIIKDGYLKTPRIIKAFKKIDRKNFVPEDFKEEAYVNAPLPIGFGQTISQPLTVAFMIELLEPEPGNIILDVGAGSGWQTAILAEIVGKYGKVFAIELIEKLAEFGKANVDKYDFIKKGRVEFVQGDGSLGLPGKA
ncbi:MAG: protein-L-isoaspartate O-methyltransferase, partial [Candidatus Portnoybacteria bacterium CG_4_10_14_0_8_um_filter_40_50]